MSLSKKFFIFLFSLCTMYFVLGTTAHAAGEFNTDFEVTYTLRENGITEVKNKITLTNIFSNLYATSYSVVLSGVSPKNIISYGSDGASYIVNTKQDEGQTNINIDFPDTVVGKGNSRTFYLTYDESSFAVKTGEVWEVTIPKIGDENAFSSYFVNLIVPKNLGQEAYISPSPRSTDHNESHFVYRFTKDDVKTSGVVAGFGQFQVFSFTLNYHLENPLSKTAQTEITLPPDTSYQKMYYTNLNPRPNSMYVDRDGNWIANYALKPRERVDVIASGQVQIFASVRPFPKPSEETLKDNLKPNTYWEVDDPNIKNLANNLKTPKAIYDYVSTTLKYDYGRVKPNVERLGASRALNAPNSAICMEFTDLFVAIARAAGIPAREVNGYAYTENPEIQPLSLVNDVLHAWPEYYDYKKNAWIPVDPTWASTTGGIDYFSKLDLRHFTFVIHGVDSVRPYPAGSYKLGINPQKDIFVSFGSLPQERNTKLQATAYLESWIPLVANRMDLEITNPGPSAYYDVLPKIYFDKNEVKYDKTIETLLPFQTHETYIEIPFSFLGTKTPEIVRVLINGQDLEVKTGKTQVIVYNLIFIFLLAIVFLVTILIRLGKISFRWKFPKKNS